MKDKHDENFISDNYSLAPIDEQTDGITKKNHIETGNQRKIEISLFLEHFLTIYPTHEGVSSIKKPRFDSIHFNIFFEEFCTKNSFAPHSSSS